MNLDRALCSLTGSLRRPLGIVDVGCRWGFADAWEKLAGVARIAGFDPDAEECARLRERYRGRPDITVVDRALAARAGSRTVHLTEEAACSSFYPPEPIVLEQIVDLSIIRPVEEIVSEATTFDEWLKEMQWGPRRVSSRPTSKGPRPRCSRAQAMP